VFRLRHKAALLLIAIPVIAAGSIAQSPATAPVVIKVEDQSGAPIPGARVKVIPVPDPKLATMETDGNGELSLRLKVGGHALFVAESGFNSDVRHIEIQRSAEGQMIPVMLKVGSYSGPVLVISDAEAAERAAELLLSAMPFRENWWITQAEFKSMPRTSVTVTNPETGKSETYSGVRLVDLLESAGVPVGAAWDDISLTGYLTAYGNRSSPGATTALFSLAELQPGLHAGEMLVADIKDGLPLGYKIGPFMLVVSADTHRVRWIQKLNRLELH
jgi:hypothetical protein